MFQGPGQNVLILMPNALITSHEAFRNTMYCLTTVLKYLNRVYVSTCFEKLRGVLNTIKPIIDENDIQTRFNDLRHISLPPNPLKSYRCLSVISAYDDASFQGSKRARSSTCSRIIACIQSENPIISSIWISRLPRIPRHK